MVNSGRDDDGRGLEVELFSGRDAVVVQDAVGIQAVDRWKQDQAVDIFATKIALNKKKIDS